MKTLTLEAPAKINLTLDILGRRTDGYHDMRMVMQAVSLGDTVTVAEAAGGFSLLTEGISLPAGKVTLEQRAADAFFHRLGRPVPGLEVRLAKRVPAYAGLGGGSADVAAVLRCLRTLYAPDLPRQALEEIGLAVGSDVPFCVRGGTCLAEGRGEILTDLPPLPDCAIVLCKACPHRSCLPGWTGRTWAPGRIRRPWQRRWPGAIWPPRPPALEMFLSGC